MSTDIQPGPAWDHGRAGRHKAVFGTPQPDAPAPLDPSKVMAGDTVTVRVDEPGIPEPFEVTGKAHVGPVAGIAVGGFPLSNEYVTLTDHQPAPEPEPALPTTVGSVVLVRGMGGNRIPLQLRPDGRGRVGWLHAAGNPWVEPIVRDHLLGIVFDAGESR